MNLHWTATPDGRNSNNVIRSEGPNKLVQETNVDNIQSRIVREIQGAFMIIVEY